MPESQFRGVYSGARRLLSRQVTAVVVALVLASAALTMSAIYVYTTERDYKKLEARAEQYLSFLEKSLAQPLWAMDHTAVADLCQAFAQNQDCALIKAADENGRLIFSKLPPPGQELIVRQVELRHEGRLIGTVELGMDLAASRQENRRLMGTVGLTVLVVVAALLALTGGLVHRLLAMPLGELQKSIDRLSSGDYQARKSDHIRYLEMERIMERFNHMAERIRRREESLTVANERLQTEIAERQRAEENLARSEQRYRQLFDSINDFIYTHDLEGKFVTVNKGAAETLGYKPEEIIGRPVPEFMLPRYRRAFYEEYLPGILREGRQEGVSIYLGRDGAAHSIEYRNFLVTKNGEPDHISGMGRDVTERLKAQDQLRRLEEQLRQSQKMEAVGTLAGGVAHDFNNILQGIRGYAQLIGMGVGLNEPMRGHVENIEAAVRRASDLVQQLLTFSRRVTPGLKPVNLNQSVGQVVGLLERTLPKMITMVTDLEEALSPIYADPTQIEQVLLNLGSNAGDAMPEGGRLLMQTLNRALDQDFCREHPEAAPGDYVLLKVADTGHGMDCGTLAHIFEPFFTTKELGKGTGLGLSIVYGIVRNHGGFILVESQPGGGTTFSVYLPARAGEIEEEKPSLKAEPLAGGGERLLLVDDDLDILNATRAVLEHFGYRVRTATSGEEALNAYRAKPGQYDLVIMDLGMPGMGGGKALEKMKELDPKVKVVICSGYSRKNVREAAAKGGAEAFLSKPYNATDMLALIRSLLGAPRAGPV